jgi:DNA-binding response OmpR family regulator
VTILVIEDEVYVAELVQETLEQQGNRCLLASNAAEADGILATDHVDAITLDLKLPGKGGLDWLESLAAAKPEMARRTLVITGSALGEPERRRIGSTGARLMFKPFRIEHLLERFREVIPSAKPGD